MLELLQLLATALTVCACRLSYDLLGSPVPALALYATLTVVMVVSALSRTLVDLVGHAGLSCAREEADRELVLFAWSRPAELLHGGRRAAGHGATRAAHGLPPARGSALPSPSRCPPMQSATSRRCSSASATGPSCPSAHQLGHRAQRTLGSRPSQELLLQSRNLGLAFVLRLQPSPNKRCPFPPEYLRTIR